MLSSSYPRLCVTRSAYTPELSALISTLYAAIAIFCFETKIKES